MELATDVSRVETARDRGVGGPFDNGTAVREESHLVRPVPELQNEVVVADSSVWLKTAIHFSEIDWTLPFMNLYRIPAAEGDVRSAFSCEVDEVVISANATSRSGLGR